METTADSVTGAGSVPCVSLVESVLGSVAGLDVDGCDVGQLEEWLRVGLHGESAFAALQAKVLVRLRRLGDEQGRRVDAAAMLTAGLGMAAREARARVVVADTLAVSPAAAAALAGGRINYGHADVLAMRVPARLRTTAACDPGLVAAATRQGVDAFARTTDDWVHRHEAVDDPDGRIRAARLHRKRKASTFTGDDGMWCLRADLPPDTGAVVAATLHSIAEHKWRTEDNRSGTLPVGDPTAPRTPGQRLADALVDLARSWNPDGTRTANRPNRRPGTKTRRRPRADTRLVVIVDHHWLTKQVADRHYDTGPPGNPPAPEIPGIGPIAPATLRRLACDAGILPVVMNGPSAVLDLGREQRTVSDDQWWALVARDRGCVFPNCDRPPTWTEAHHIHWWTRDHGPTNLDNLTLLCSRHHHLVHEGNWTITGHPTTGLDFHPGHQQPPPRPPRPHNPDIHPTFRQDKPAATSAPMRC